MSVSVKFKIPLSKGAFAIVDEDDFDLLSSSKWYLSSSGYATRDEGGRKNKHRVRMHRRVLGYEGPLEVDHINGDKLDNRKCNLRISHHHENGRNRGKQINNTSGHKGVSWDKFKGKWVAQIHVFGKHIFLGRFSDINDAKRARDEASKKYHGEFLHIA